MKKYVSTIVYVCIVMMIVSGCSSSLQDKIDAMYGTEEGNAINDTGLAYVESGDYDKAIEAFEKARDEGLALDVYYNNMCYTYNEMEDYETAYAYALKANEINSDDSVQLANTGDCLYGLGQMDEALVYYEKSLALDEDQSVVYWSIGETYYSMGEYEQAIECYEDVLEYEPDNLEVKLSIISAKIDLDQLLDANSYADKVIEEHPDAYDAYDYKGFLLEYLETEKNVKAFYDEVKTLFPQEIDSWMNLGYYYYDIDAYNKAIAVFETAAQQFPNNSEIYSNLSSAYSYSGDVKQAHIYGEKALDLEDNSYNNNNLGDVLFNEGKYLEAVTYYAKAIDILEYPMEDYYVDEMYALYSADRYKRCIDVGLEAKEVLHNPYDIDWIIGYAYQERNDYEESNAYIQSAIEIQPDSDYLYYVMAENYYYMGEYKQCETALEQSLSIDPDNEDAIDLRETLELRHQSNETLIRTCVRDYYLYEEDDTQEALGSDSELTDQEAQGLFYSLVESDDPYSFYINNGDYRYMIEDGTDSINFSSSNDEVIVAINFFGEDTDHLFIEYLDDVMEPEQKDLIINLIDNGGGSTDSATNMLDALLPSLTACTLIDRDGYTYPYYTDESMIAFDHIYIIINENSASASELLTLGLDTFLDNVTIIGEQSHGKGVGQIVIDDPVRESAMYIVNHYWNVREINISAVGIEPDIWLNTPTLESALEVIHSR